MNKIKSIKRKKTGIIAIITLLFFAIALIIYFALYRSTEQNPENEQHTKTETIIMGSLEIVKVDQLMENSSLIVTGTLEGKSEAFTVKNTNDREWVFTDYYIKPIKTYRSAPETEPKEGETITVRMEGGETKNKIVTVEGYPKIEKDKEYLFFLYQPRMGGAGNTKGDYFYVYGGIQGAYYKADNPQNVKLGALKTGDIEGDIFINSAVAPGESVEARTERMGRTASGKDNVLSAFIVEKSFEKQIEAVNKAVPVNIDFHKEQVEKNVKGNLETEFISQEEYDEIMKSISEYAVIVED